MIVVHYRPRSWCEEGRSIIVRSILCPSVVLSGAGSAAQSGDFTYAVNQSTITITQYTGDGGSVAIPATVDGMAVTMIGSGAFFSNTVVTSVALPKSVTSFGERVFAACDVLASATVDAATVGTEFSGLNALKNVTLGTNVISVGRSAFSGCSGVRSINLPDTVTSVGAEAFKGCSGTTNLSDRS